MNDFELWWHHIGSGMPPLKNEEASVHAWRVAAEAWKRSEYVAKHPRSSVNHVVKKYHFRCNACSTPCDLFIDNYEEAFPVTCPYINDGCNWELLEPEPEGDNDGEEQPL